MRFRQQSMVIPGDAKSFFAVADRLQHAFAAQIEKCEALDGLQVLRGHAHTVHENAGGSTKILRAFEARIAGRLLARPRSQPYTIYQGIEVASLNGSIADQYFCSIRAQRRFNRSADHRGMSYQAVQPTGTFVLV